MNQLTILTKGNQQVVDSREVAEMIGKTHAHLLRDIAGYCGIITNSNESNFGLVDFFVESSYQDSKGEVRPCYLLTKKGCDMVANKMTGEKGVLFTAAYVTAFEQMREHIQQTNLSGLSPQLQLLINMEMEQKRQAEQLATVEQKVDGIRDLVAINPNGWREDCRKLIARIAQTLGGMAYIRDVNTEVYDLVDARAGVSLAVRLTNKRRRMADEGVCRSTRDKLSKVDVIADDKKLIEIYIKVVRELAVKYGVAR